MRGLKRRRPQPPQAHMTTSYGITALANPNVLPTSLGCDRVYIGEQIYGQLPFYWDGKQCYQLGLVADPNTWIQGKIGLGKSSLGKTYAYRQMQDIPELDQEGRRVWIVSVKKQERGGEYDKLCRLMNTEPLRFGSKGLKINPLDSRVAQQEQFKLLRSICILLLMPERKYLRPEENTALQIAHSATLKNRNCNLETLTHSLLYPELTEGQQSTYNITSERAEESGRDLAHALRRLLGDGDLSGILDGDTSRQVDLNQKLVVFDLCNLSNDAIPIAATCMAAWLGGVRQQAVDQGASSPVDIVEYDECWDLFQYLEFGQTIRRNFKLARADGTENIITTHRFNDATAAGAAGSLEVKLAESLISEASTHVIYRQEDGADLAEINKHLEFSDSAFDLIRGFGKGEALWKVGAQVIPVRHRLSDTGYEKWLVDTDDEMQKSRKRSRARQR